MFSFSGGSPFAIIKGGKNKGKILYLDKNAKVSINQSKNASVLLSENETFQLIPSSNPEDRDTLYIAGSTGSGKTEFATDYINYYLQINPNNDVVIFPANCEDKTLHRNLDLEDEAIDIVDICSKDENGQYRIISEKVNLKDFSNSLVVFDDRTQVMDPYADKIQVKELQNFMEKLNETVISVGRHQNTAVISIQQLLLNYRETRLLINDSKYVVVFPRGGGRHLIEMYLHTYLGVKDKAILNEIYSWNTRWIVFHQKFPLCALWDTEPF